jgi:hypothetical protein
VEKKRVVNLNEDNAEEEATPPIQRLSLVSLLRQNCFRDVIPPPARLLSAR